MVCPLAVADEGDIYGEVATLLYEFLGAVERVNEEELRSDRRHSPRGNLFFSNDRDVRGDLPQSLEGFQHPDQLAATMRRAGLIDVSVRRLALGAVAIHRGRVPTA